MTKARGDLPDTNAELSEAARAVVRDAGDPRTDAYLAALGLVDTPAPKADAPTAEPPRAAGTAVPTPATPRVATEQLALPVAPAQDPEVEPLRARVAELELALRAAAARVRMLSVALVIAVVGLVVLAALLVTRPA